LCLKAEPCAGQPHIFQVERRDHVSVPIDRRLKHQFIVGVGAGWPPDIVEHNWDTERGQCIRDLRGVDDGSWWSDFLLPRHRVAMQSAEKISITLPPEMLRLLRDAVADGEYASTSEALRDAVRAWHRQRLEDTERLAALRARAQQSLADPAPSLSEAEADARLAALFAASGAGDAAL
jgi:antitoxin ParD1/3/4